MRKENPKKWCTMDIWEHPNMRNGYNIGDMTKAVWYRRNDMGYMTAEIWNESRRRKKLQEKKTHTRREMNIDRCHASLKSFRPKNLSCNMVLVLLLVGEASMSSMRPSVSAVIEHFVIGPRGIWNISMLAPLQRRRQRGLISGKRG